MIDAVSAHSNGVQAYLQVLWQGEAHRLPQTRWQLRDLIGQILAQLEGRQVAIRLHVGDGAGRPITIEQTPERALVLITEAAEAMMTLIRTAQVRRD